MYGNGIVTTFSFPFVAGLASNVQVILVNLTTGAETLLTSGYTVALNAATTGSIWGVGGTVTYTPGGNPITNTQALIISRIVPLTQLTGISNQGALLLTAIEQALDTLCMEIQQVSAKTGQLRGTWATGVVYSYGDVVQDGANGANTTNYYMCNVSNTSGTWSTDLTAGFWSLAVNTQAISGYATAAAASASAASSSASSASSSATSASSSAGTATAAASTATTQAGIATSAAATAVAQGNSITDTSTTSLTIGTGAKTLTVSASKQFATGQFILVSYASDSTKYMHGQVTSYSGTTLIINVLDTGGSGTYASWNVSVSGSQGATGPSGGVTSITN